MIKNYRPVSLSIILLTLYLSACASTGDPSFGDAPSAAELSLEQLGTDIPRLNDPIILVHGFLGFDSESETGLAFPYWGGTLDLEKRLTKRGFQVHTARVGPVSSNWDRACELYAYIKGGWVDYGAAHARKFGHARYGEYYPGVFPEWGSVSAENGRIQKVHLIGHSMGGQTARLLTELLAYGSRAEIRAASQERTAEAKAMADRHQRARRAERSDRGLSELFTGGHRWVASITTIATPHDGTTLTQRYEDVGTLERLFARMVTRSSLQKEDPLIQLHLQHWAERRRENETFEQFLMRAIRRDLWQDTEDFSYFDLTLQGAMQLNMQTTTHSDVYYFSWATSRTVPEGPEGHHVPMRGMSLLLHPSARYMGSLTELPSKVAGEPEQWWENDGIVNTCSMDGPSLGRHTAIKRYTEPPKPGVWNFMGTLKPLDHLQVSLVLPISGDAPPGYASLAEFYERWCRFLVNLPAEDSDGFEFGGEFSRGQLP